MTEVTQADRDAARQLELALWAGGAFDSAAFLTAFRRAAEAPLRAENARLRHIASDLVQHIDWLTNGLPAMLDNGGLTDEEGLIGAAVDAANSARAALAQETGDD